MKRLWGFLSRMDLGFWLLVCASLSLFAGTLVADFNEALFKELDFAHLPSWLQPLWSSPWLYGWMVVLFGVLLVLAFNTAVCTTVYTATAIRTGHLTRKLGIVLFHLAFLLALGGHCLSLFTGFNDRLVIESGKAVPIEETGLTVETLQIRKVSPAADDSHPPLSIEARLRVVPRRGEPVEVDVATMRPRLVQGYVLSLSFMDRGLSGDQARLVVRRDYGLVLVVLAGLTACFAIALFLFFSLPATRGNREAARGAAGTTGDVRRYWRRP